MSDNTTKPSTAFIDLATYDNYEKVMYGLDNAVTYFVRETVRSTWFTQIPIRLNMDGADTDFGKTFSAQISRAGDYLVMKRIPAPATIIISISSTTLMTLLLFVFFLVLYAFSKC